MERESTTMKMGMSMKVNGKRMSAGGKGGRHIQMAAIMKGFGTRMKSMGLENLLIRTEKRQRSSITWESSFLLTAINHKGMLKLDLANNHITQ